MAMRLVSFPSLRRYHVPAVLALIFLFLLFSTQSAFPRRPSWVPNAFGGPQRQRPPPTDLPELRIVAGSHVAGPPESDFCTDRFGPKYLGRLRDHSIQYCSSPRGGPGASRLTCFHGRYSPDDASRVDSLCIGQGAVLDAATKKYTLYCDVRSPAENESASGLIPFDSLREYWYETGPKHVVEGAVAISKDPPAPPPQGHKKTSREQFTVLVKREGHGNLWHSLMEIWSLTHTIDVLRLSADPARGGAAFFEAPEDVANAQVVLLDGHPDGPFFSLWKLLTGHQPIRLSEALGATGDKPDGEENTAGGVLVPPGLPHNIIIPLAGGSNPLWQNDWEDRDCRDAPLLKIFIRRLLEHYHIESFDPAAQPVSRSQSSGQPGEKKLRLTIIDRRGTRKILGLEGLVDAARRAHPDVEIRVVDFGAISFPEQIGVVRETDILVGAHGAGLTHTMFLPGAWEAQRAGRPDSHPRKAVVEIQPEEMNYRGFRNLGKMLGHEYFVTKAQTLSAEDLKAEAESKAKEAEKAAKQAKEEAEGLKGKASEAHTKREEEKPVLDDDDETLASREIRRRSGGLAKRDKWHFADLRIGEKEFLDLLASAIRYVQDKA